jgi:peptide/nickel transport system permease protein
MAAPDTTESIPAPDGPRARLRRLLSNPLAAVGLVLFLLVSTLALFAPQLAPQNPYDLSQFSLIDSRLPPGATGLDGTTHWLGTDAQGRDMLSAILYGLRTSMFVGIASSLIALVIGTAAGLVAGYIGGRTDAVIMRLVDLQLSIPSILVALILLSVLGRGVENIIIALVTVQWVYFARTARAQVLVERDKPYVEAGRLLGYGDGRLVFVHILPNALPPLTVVLTVEFAHAIALEATLSFLGVGLPITEPSLGYLISAGFAFLLNGEYWISIFPGIALLVAVFSLNLLGDELRDVLNPRLQK